MRVSQSEDALVNGHPSDDRASDFDRVGGLSNGRNGSKSPALEDDGIWEDDPDINSVHPYGGSLTPSSPSRNTRRRKGKTLFVAQPNSNRKYPSSKAKDAKGDVSPSIEIDRKKIKVALSTGASHTLLYIYTVMRDALKMLRLPLVALVFLWMLAFLLSHLTHTFRTVLSPICYIPGISRTPLCYTTPHKQPKWADYPQLVAVEGSTFEQLLDETVGGSGLSLEVKKAEMATTDLVTLVKVSDLKSKDLLAKSLMDFVNDAKKSARGLQKLSSKIGGAVDNIVAVNDHALHTIEAHVNKPKSILSYISPFSSGVSTKEVVVQTFTGAMSVLSTQLQRVVIEAEVSLVNLENLEQRLITLHELLSRENASLSNEKDELLADLWTILGGNKRKRKGLEGHLFLLKNIGAYRTRALAHVTAALHTLQGMQADMEDLRERVAAPEIVGEKIPVEVHMKSIKAGLDRLTEQRYRQREREEEAVKRIMGIEED